MITNQLKTVGSTSTPGHCPYVMTPTHAVPAWNNCIYFSQLRVTFHSINPSLSWTTSSPPSFSQRQQYCLLKTAICTNPMSKKSELSQSHFTLQLHGISNFQKNKIVIRLLAAHRMRKSRLQYHNSNILIIFLSASLIVQVPDPYSATLNTSVLTKRTSFWMETFFSLHTRVSLPVAV